MAYKKQEIIDLCMEVIESRNVIFIEELICYLPISKSAFYNWNLHEMDSIKDAITASKVDKKAQLREMWMMSENATLQVANYKLMATDEEHDRLTMNRSDITTKGDKIEGNAPVMITMAEAKKRLEDLENEI